MWKDEGPVESVDENKIFAQSYTATSLEVIQNVCATSGRGIDGAAATARNFMDAAKLHGHGFHVLLVDHTEAFDRVVREVVTDIHPDTISLSQHLRKLGLTNEQTDRIR